MVPVAGIARVNIGMKAAVAPAGTICPARAASMAANVPSAIPACASTPQVSAVCSTSRSAASASPP